MLGVGVRTRRRRDAVNAGRWVSHAEALRRGEMRVGWVFRGADEFGARVSRGDAVARRNAGGVGGTRRRIGLEKRSHAETLRRGEMQVG